jgi:integrase
MPSAGAPSPDGVRWQMNALAAKAGLDHLPPHQDRHTVAYDLLMNGGQKRGLNGSPDGPAR